MNHYLFLAFLAFVVVALVIYAVAIINAVKPNPHPLAGPLVCKHCNKLLFACPGPPIEVVCAQCQERLEGATQASLMAHHGSDRSMSRAELDSVISYCTKINHRETTETKP
jgi:phage FluMu protein Com